MTNEIKSNYSKLIFLLEGCRQQSFSELIFDLWFNQIGAGTLSLSGHKVLTKVLEFLGVFLHNLADLLLMFGFLLVLLGFQDLETQHSNDEPFDQHMQMSS